MFVGWATTASATEALSSLSSSLYTSVTSSKTYYAVWADPVTITLKANGGTFPSVIDSSGEASISTDKKTVTDIELADEIGGIGETGESQESEPAEELETFLPDEEIETETFTEMSEALEADIVASGECGENGDNLT